MNNPAAEGMQAARQDFRAAENLARIIGTIEEHLSEAEKDGNHEAEFAFGRILEALYDARPLSNGRSRLTLDLASVR